MASKQQAPSVDHAAAIGKWGLSGGIAGNERTIAIAPKWQVKS